MIWVLFSNGQDPFFMKFEKDIITMKKLPSNPLSSLSNEELQQISIRISDYRKQCSINQSDFALSLHISQTYLSLIESGKKYVSYDLLKKICSRYGLSMSWLIDGKGGTYSRDNDERMKNDEKQAKLSSFCSDLELSGKEKAFLSWFINLPEKKKADLISSLEKLRYL